MTDALTQLRDALQTVITTSEHALVPRAMLRELLARLEAAEAVVDAAQMVMDDIHHPSDDYMDHSEYRVGLDAALSAHANLKDATP